MHWNDSISALKGIGPETTALAAKIGLATIKDVLLHLPHRYEDRSAVTQIANAAKQTSAIAIQGQVANHLYTPGKRASLTVTVRDQTGFLRVLFYGRLEGIKENTPIGSTVRFYGKVKPGRNGLEMSAAEYIRIVPDEKCPWDVGLKPIYPLSEGVSNARVTRMVKLAVNAMPLLGFPESLTPQLGISLKQAIQFVHEPPADCSLDELSQRLHPAQQRLILDELTAQQLNMQMVRHVVKVKRAPCLCPDLKLEQEFNSQVSFKFTGAQCRVIKEIQADLAKEHPMLRLLQGDVGSGKTLVAAMAALTALAGGYQVVLMAPTELLAEQHVITFGNWFEPLGISVTGMSGRRGGKKAKDALIASIASGSSQMVIGTHAVLQNDIQFANVGLIIIDEQHRFGVKQRLALLEKVKHPDGYTPHQLVMTATPIPRTLQMTAFADLDASIIDELPPGRKAVKTIAMSDLKRNELCSRVLNTIQEKKQQVYWVCPLVEESESKQTQAAESLYLDLHRMLPNVRIGIVHGRMKPKDKQQVMAAFSSGDIDVLVATTVIEVGVNVPNATLMIIENSERLGLAQLHQLRGRVGRGSLESYCMLIYKAPLSNLQRERIGIMRETNDGFIIAQKDLENRGAGDVLGSQQAGLVKYHIADLSLDSSILPAAQSFAKFVAQDRGQAEALCEFWFSQSQDFMFV